MSNKTARPARRPKAHIRAGDTVYVRSGRDRESRLTPEEIDRLDSEAQRREADRRPGRRGRVLRVLPDHKRVIVEGINMVTKHARPRGRATRATQLQAGRMEQPGPIAIANVMLVCPRCDRPTRVRRGTFENKTARICRRCGEPVDVIR
ncbi:MAG: 50S ribosomal protein L24 [Armatimonadota bacterium]|nr:MAG: 50S ribosomal protein L24 [Armatimonadota bacterium]